MTVSHSPVRRRTQADRSAVTRTKIIQAAVSLLQTQGYAATTIQRIAKTAEVSLGALQHHYPTKALIMATVLRHYAVKRAGLYRHAMSLKGRPEERVDAMLDAMWALVTDGPDFIATVEIELARRSDPELKAATEPVLARIDQFMTRWLSGSRKAPPDAHFVRLRQINSALLRGISVEIARGTSVSELKDSYMLWRNFTRQELLKITVDKP
ncbi:TetR/AcrR family transcriptional regulator [Acetobacter conturbans]|uniref:TetR family transcriptional regulator n=1 Tax=Acetobacter conturbans TaxID=1737472 RepID=A0ABX0K0W7_9PROT|nr:TetR/AcrR family transcriptional regulator [Acetobacter conturbans]NHN88461.1 TetR family transcriptional regulator [Acetobacter conturbans]